MYNYKDFIEKKEQICVIGLGYVGLPLACLFAKEFKILGFDIDKNRVKELNEGFDRTKEVDNNELKNPNITFTTDTNSIKESKLIIVTVPTPVNSHKIPDLTAVKSATKNLAKYISKGSIIVYESTVYPGVTEDECVPIIENESGYKWKKDFHIGYSPERVNPGDKLHTIDKIQKIVSSDTKEVTDFLAEIYGTLITAGIHKAPTIKVAESAKVIENIQRDLNIALVNELSIIFDKMDIDTNDVLDAAATKWNFIKYSPGLVGGHCIGVDPYYLTYKSESIGYHAQLILAGRKINDNMGNYVAEKTVKKLIEADKQIKASKVLILGFTFKENISDIRNTKVIDIYEELKTYKMENIHIYDPYVYKDEIEEEYGIQLIDDIEKYKPYDAIIVAVQHKEFLEKFNIENLKALSNNNKFVLIDIKGIYDRDKIKNEDIVYWRL